MSKNSLKKVLCRKCNKIFSINNQNKIYAGYVLSGLLIGAFLFIGGEDSFDFRTKLYGIIITLLIYGLAMFFLYYSYKQDENCTECNGKKTVIPIDTPEAEEIIQKNNLTIPE